MANFLSDITGQTAKEDKMKNFRTLLGGIFVFGCCLLLCKSQDTGNILDVENPVSLSKSGAGQYIIIYNVDIISTDEGDLFFKPNEDYSWKSKNSYTKGENDKDMSGIYAGIVITNVKKVVIYVDGDNLDYLYYEESEETVIMNYLEGESQDPECTKDSDCIEIYGNPPTGLVWGCDEGTCKLG